MMKSEAGLKFSTERNFYFTVSLSHAHGFKALDKLYNKEYEFNNNKFDYASTSSGSFSSVNISCGVYINQNAGGEGPKHKKEERNFFTRDRTGDYVLIKSGLRFYRPNEAIILNGNLDFRYGYTYHNFSLEFAATNLYARNNMNINYGTTTIHNDVYSYSLWSAGLAVRYHLNVFQGSTFNFHYGIYRIVRTNGIQQESHFQGVVVGEQNQPLNYDGVISSRKTDNKFYHGPGVSIEWPVSRTLLFHTGVSVVISKTANVRTATYTIGNEAYYREQSSNINGLIAEVGIKKYLVAR